MIFPGSVYITGVISTYIVSYYRIPADDHIVADLLPFCLFINMFFMPIGSHLAQKNVNPRLLILIGGCVAFPCFFIASFMKSFTGYAIFYVFGFAINQGMVYMVPVHHGWLWFPNNPGLVSGIILGGFGLGSLIFDNVLTHVVNPDNISVDSEGFYPKSVDDRFMLMWRVLVGSWLFITIVGAIMIFPGPVPKSKLEGIVGTTSNGQDNAPLINQFDQNSDLSGQTKSFNNPKEDLLDEVSNMPVTKHEAPMMRMIFS